MSYAGQDTFSVPKPTGVACLVSKPRETHKTDQPLTC